MATVWRLCGVVQCDKNDYRFILLGLEGVTGRTQWIRTPWR
jgi:hypothetical protein